MLLSASFDSLELVRGERIIYARFLAPRLVLSTCRINGGLRGDLKFVANHQSCESVGHETPDTLLAVSDPAGYHERVCGRHGLDPGGTVLLGTAANMRLAVVKEIGFRDLSVMAVVTGGVEGNAGRAGDPAGIFEGPDGFETVGADERNKVGGGPAGGQGGPGFGDGASRGQTNPFGGTINTLLFVNRPLSPGALTRSVMTAAEAKTAALVEINVNSRFSPSLATGTGTDQIAVAAPLPEPGGRALTGAGKHAKLGELMGLAVLEATKEVLIRQTGLTVDRQCSVKILLERFHARGDGTYGLDAGEFVSLVSRFLDPGAAVLFRDNYKAVFHDPLTVSAVAAMAAVEDKLAAGILPRSVQPEIMAAQAAVLARAAGGGEGLPPDCLEKLSPYCRYQDVAGFLRLACAALAAGFARKWPK
ncbi:MAG: adenosylcobinamide amidohydrolase [Deltaproteobacteria bacterium]|jgi:adenosylcobinamide amidohydrolase|nr:adenosylcobinamide amidohydrolase [Deltaproteobacteria bacterium]